MKSVEYSCGHVYIKSEYGVIDARCPRCGEALYGDGT